jgi:protein TonB
MKSQFEFITFGFVAISIHIAGFMSTPDKGSQSSGDEGQHLISLQQVTPQFEALLEEWTSKPEVQTRTPQLKPLKTIVPLTPSLTLATAMPQQVQVVLMPNRPEIARPKFPLHEVVIAQRPTVKGELENEKLDQMVTTMLQRPKRRPETMHVVDSLPAKNIDIAKEKAQEASPRRSNLSSSQAGREKQKAAGFGGGSSAGISKKSKTTTGKSVESANALAAWGAQVRKKIERNKRSVGGLKRRAKAMITITVLTNGTVQSIRLSKSSGNKKADASALRAVKAAGRMPKAVNGVQGHKITFTIPLIFKP